MRGRKKTDATRAAIVRCAAEVFSGRDFHEVRTDDIVQQLGIGKGTLYRYFDSKEAMYLAAIADGLDGLHTAVTEVLQQDAPVEATVDAVVRTMVRYFHQQRHALLLLARLEPQRKPHEREAWQTRRTEVVTLVRRALDRAAARGEIARLNTRLAVEALFGMIRGVCVYRAESDRPDDLSRLIIGLFFHGLRSGTWAKAPRRQALVVVQGGA